MKLEKIRKNITFYHTDIHEYQLCKYISDEAKSKNYKTQFTSNLNQKSEIGFYCQDKVENINAKLSIISIHGMDQGKVAWPNIWKKESWKNFDIGILPGNNWKNNWLESCWDPNSRTKKGIYLTGWPKTQKIFLNKKKFYQKSKDLQKKLRLPFKKTILYAPNMETDNKQIDLINAIHNEKINLLVKHLPWALPYQEKKYKDIRNNIKIANSIGRKKLKNSMRVINSQKNIMNYYAMVDLLVTDESSVKYEAMLFNLPTLSVSDWVMRTNNVNSPRLPVLNSKEQFICKRINLKKKIIELISNKYNKKKIKNLKYRYFSNLEKSCDIFYQVLNNVISSKYNHPALIKPFFKSQKIIIYLRLVESLLRRIKIYVLNLV